MIKPSLVVLLIMGLVTVLGICSHYLMSTPVAPLVVITMLLSFCIAGSFVLYDYE